MCKNARLPQGVFATTCIPQSGIIIYETDALYVADAMKHCNRNHQMQQTKGNKDKDDRLGGGLQNVVKSTL